MSKADKYFLKLLSSFELKTKMCIQQFRAWLVALYSVNCVPLEQYFPAVWQAGYFVG